MDLKVSFRRDASGDSHCFSDIFAGFDKVEAVTKLFGKRSGEVLGATKIRLVKTKGYLRVDNDTGDIIVCQPYLKTADERHFYLDLIHELVHVRQFHEGKDLYNKQYAYVDRPTEIEAYAVAVDEARRIGMSEHEIIDYLKVDWVSDADFQRMLKALKVTKV